MLGVVANVEVYPDRVDEFVRTFSALATAVRSDEPRNHLYVLGRVRGADNRFVVMELYEDQSAIEFHRQTEHVRVYGPKLAEMQSRPIEITYSDTVGYPINP